mmetsp:Transcript_57052/g.146846  ORF Transcript_57052/g.146846 Transcript_57052/m.146846 type:complete len:139 (-) Transcript_57052:455-871(-)
MKPEYLEDSSDASCSWVPDSRTTPFSRTMILVARTTVESRCAMMKVVLPTISASMAFCTMCSFSLSSALVASSSSRTFGSRMMARAIATRCFWPPEIRAARSPGCVSYPSERSWMKSCALACLAAFSTSPSLFPWLLP